MALDPVRAARVRRMLPDKTTWPGTVLAMKRIEEGCIVEFGDIRSSTAPFFIHLGPGRAPLRFDTVDELIAAGWAVD
ncbi:hypothetical protein [Azospirillum sp. Sh1]|uniref:hypothetical protein n=1 Tax=Azospirillum sp. Sh1 TaxID=2607285 RepID=UPI0011F06B0E|nr:hypothetical protein [Azospirillum sp. Sh1]KAA0573468.1 hypothetical protein FZ029_21055 [Azospirillum sp. Sh1]